MARLAATEKASFYPTPSCVVDMIATMVNPSIGAVILDPCCGEGDALAALGKAWQAVTVGNELSKERAKKAAAKCDVVTHGPIEFVEVEGQASALFLNPPYDVGASGQRLEFEFLEMATPWLMPGGWLFYIIPDYVLEEDAIVDYLIKHFEYPRTWRFPDGEYEVFKQVVVTGCKLATSLKWYYREKELFRSELKAPMVLGAIPNPWITLPAVANVPEITVSLPDADETLTLAAEQGPMATQVWENLTSPRGLIGNFQPVNKPLPGHAAMLVIDGKVDGTEVESNEGKLLLKGTHIKVIKAEETSERDGDKVRHRKSEKERIVSVIHALNLDTGELKDYSSQAAEEFEAFLTQHQDTLIGAVDALYPPLFVPNRDMMQWFSKLKRIHGPQPLPGSTLNGLLPKQAECAVALAMLLERQKCGLLIGECGVGKTCISLALQGLSNGGNFKVVVMAPAQVCAKWARESERVLQEFGLKSHIIGQKRGKGRGKPILDIVSAMEEPNPSLLVMSYETAKNGAPWEPAFSVKKRKVTWTEAKVKHVPYYPYEEEYEEEFSEVRDVASCPDCGVVLRDKDGKPWPTNKAHSWWKKEQRFCPKCSKPDAKTSLFQSLPFKYGGRFAAATFLNRHYAGRFSFALDEAHNAKARDTDIGQATMKLVSAAKTTIGMTGTIYDGKASGVFAILYRMLPEFRQLYDFTQVQKFVEHHGLQETIITKTTKASSRSTSSWGYGRENVRTKEMPGVTPGIISWLLRMSVFLRKEHVSSSLPPYTEYRVPVQTTKSQGEVLSDLAAAHGTAAAKCRKGSMGLMSQWLYAACGALDYNEPDVIADEDDSFGIAGATIEPGELLPKDRAVLDIVKREVAEGRGVGIYFAQVNRRPWMPRFQKILENEGIYSEILMAATCKKADREAWFQSLVARCKAKRQPVVMLANGNLVKEGLDLVECPTLIETGIDFRLINVLQRDQRAHRITQDKDCKVYFVYYEGTFQETALSLVASKARAARKVDGKLVDGLAQMGAEEDLMSALIKAAQKGAKPMAIDWGELSVEAIRPKREIRFAVELYESGDVKSCHLVEREPVCDMGHLPKEICPVCDPEGHAAFMDDIRIIPGLCGVEKDESSTSRAQPPLPISGAVQLTLF